MGAWSYRQISQSARKVMPSALYLGMGPSGPPPLPRVWPPIRRTLARRHRRRTRAAALAGACTRVYAMCTACVLVHAMRMQCIWYLYCARVSPCSAAARSRPPAVCSQPRRASAHRSSPGGSSAAA